MTKLQDNIRDLLDLHSPQTVPGTDAVITPRQRPVYHGDDCNCDSCCDMRAAVDNYLKARTAFNINGF